MKGTKRWVSLLSATILMLFGADPVKSSQTAKHYQHVKVVFEEWPPYQFTEKGKVRGTDTEILLEIGKRLGIEFSFESVPWVRALKSVETGVADAIFSLSKNEKREKMLVFPKTPINFEKKVFFSLTNKHRKVARLGDLAGLRVGVVRGNFFGNGFDKEKGFVKVETSSQEQLFRMLSAGRFDVCLTSDKVGMSQAKSLKMNTEIIQQPFIWSEMPLYIAFSKSSRQDSEKLAEDFSKVFVLLQQKGIIKKILSKYYK